MFTKFKSILFPTKENKYHSPILSYKVLLIFIVFLSFINLALPSFAYGSGINNSQIFVSLNKIRQDNSESTLYMNQNLDSSAKSIVNNMFQYQYFGRINPVKGTSFYSFVNMNKFSNINLILFKNYVSQTSFSNTLIQNYNNIIINPNINDLGIYEGNGVLNGNNVNIIAILTAKGAHSNIIPLFTNNNQNSFINYKIIEYTDLFILLFITLLLIGDVIVTYYYKIEREKMISNIHLPLLFVSILVVFVLIIGISL
jgi:hypothetical protein